MIDKFNRIGNIWINKLDSEVDSGNQICLMDYFNRAALASIVTVSSELLLSQKKNLGYPIPTLKNINCVRNPVLKKIAQCVIKIDPMRRAELDERKNCQTFPLHHTARKNQTEGF